MSTQYSSFLFLGLFTRNTTYAAECKWSDVLEIKSGAFTDDCTAPNGDISCRNDCRTKLDDFVANFEPTDCTVNGESFGESFEDLVVAQYNKACDTNVTRSDANKTNEDDASNSKLDGKNPQSSGAHGFSAVHYLLAILVPMALLYL